MNSTIYRILLTALLLQTAAMAFAQRRPPNVLRGVGDRIPGLGNQRSIGGGNTGGDSVVARNRFEDSITIRIYYFDSTRFHKPDSSIIDHTIRFPIPATHIHLGNTGVATRSIIFDPAMRAGFDAGFHALDVYKFKPEQVQFYNTTRPFTELGYSLGSRAEQIIDILHTQNIRPSWNFSFNYRMINAPGLFRNRNSNHNNYLFTSWYQGRKKRYNNYLVILANRLQSAESGGIPDESYIDDPEFAKDRFSIPTRIGGSPVYGTNFFSTKMYVGNKYNEFNILLRQQYDLGQKDSLVQDSVVIPLFYPRLRFEHSFNYGSYSYSFQDFPVNDPSRHTNAPDPVYYSTYYNLNIQPSDSVFFRDRWHEISNDLSLIQYPDARNLHQFIKAGASLQLLNGSFRDSADRGSTSIYNVALHGEYRNRTRNQKWDLLAKGKLYLGGYNAGDYHAYAHIQRLISARLGSIQIGFENVNRRPSFIYDQRSAFYLDEPKSFNKENTTHLFARLDMPRLRLQLGADYYLLGNYLYLNGYRQLQQESTLFNVLRLNARKTFRVGRRWNLHSEVYVQQKTGGVQLNLPAVFTRNRFLYEGTLGFPNLNIAFGLEARYHTPYFADNYSPVLGQFFYQDTVKISNLPDVAALVHFRIRSFKAYFRAENLNTARVFGGLQFNNNNLAAPGYPTPGLLIRFGIYWGFVN